MLEVYLSRNSLNADSPDLVLAREVLVPFAEPRLALAAHQQQEVDHPRRCQAIIIPTEGKGMRFSQAFQESNQVSTTHNTSSFYKIASA
jgi:hypothetical protein